ncbi:NAD(P)-dependent oxidoreductase [Sphaerisporangium sp. TRM90804]|uniref:NAD-dependent epimerase/dehydratase family protein n=1 Tax=Sphaerisporangium sp. TRM90804 TaxID=3031113 RepID=UPI0024486228|nr:NAD(P)-dependent oxidoreductase [Sphaerisporangium sp. TRM90804]MDH2424762.1 NAD(P)-dependent oxidoreductase [Sphaerisporangium sp. TRM90804]
MKVLVTGSAGFLGRHLVAALDGHDVSTVDIVHGANALDVFRLSDRRFDLVLHAAAVQPHRSAIDTSPVIVGAGCLELDAALFGWAARTKPGRIVYFSSSAAYPIALQRPGLNVRLTERHIDLTVPEQPDAIYGWVKLLGEQLAEAYRKQGGAVTVVRPFSGYGEDQGERFPFGAFQGRAQRQEDPFTIWGDGTQVRDWIHVDDLVGATLTAAREGVDGPVNLCTGIGTSMTELAELFAKEAGYSPTFDYKADAPAGVAYRVGDPTGMLEFYQPRVSLAEGVRRALGAP